MLERVPRRLCSPFLETMLRESTTDFVHSLSAQRERHSLAKCSGMEVSRLFVGLEYRDQLSNVLYSRCGLLLRVGRVGTFVSYHFKAGTPTNHIDIRQNPGCLILTSTATPTVKCHHAVELKADGPA